MQLGLGVPPATAPFQQVLVCPGNIHHCWTGLVLPRSPDGTQARCQEPPVPWGSAPQSPEPSSAAMVPASPERQGTVTTSWHWAQHECSLCWEVLLDAAPGCSAYIHLLLIALKIFKD